MWKYSDLLYVPMFFGESALFIGLVLMTFYSIYELYERITNLKNKKIKEEGITNANNSTS
jgi:TRAP-type C4-dicarboxylate transport system permease small subunit